MRALSGQELVNYLVSLKAYEFKQACKKPIGERVLYYRVQTEWIMQELRELKITLQPASL